MQFIRRALVAGAILAAAMGASAPASAAVPVCSTSDLTPNQGTVLGCSGWFTGNLLTGGSVAQQQAAMAQLGVTWDGVYATVDATKINVNGSVINYAGTLNGLFVLGLKIGDAIQPNGGLGYTAFYLVSGTDIDPLTFTGGNGTVSSSAYFKVSTAVPEPGTWAMMLIGFAGVGLALRRRRRPLPALA